MSLWGILSLQLIQTRFLYLIRIEGLHKRKKKQLSALYQNVQTLYGIQTIPAQVNTSKKSMELINNKCKLSYEN